MKTTVQLLCAVFVLTMMNAGAFGQSCPNWSPKFDEITNSEVKSQLQQMNWDAAIEQAGGPDAAIVAFNSILADARSRLDVAARDVQQLAADRESAQLDATWDECSGPRNALMAAKCEYLNMTELILSAEGSIELVQCRQ